MPYLRPLTPQLLHGATTDHDCADYAILALHEHLQFPCWPADHVCRLRQSWKARQEARAARESALYSVDCLEFVIEDGTCVNLVPLETLHSLPKPGDIVLLPGDGMDDGGELAPGAYRIDKSSIFTPGRM